jgi:ABC-type Fe3+/spermidine/putrescine transport system ATPase subunit
MVTHNQEEAMPLSHRIAVLSKGRIEQIDTPQYLYSASQLVRRELLRLGKYLRRVIMTWGFGVALKTQDRLNLPLPHGIGGIGQHSKVMLRPEAVRLIAGGDDAVVRCELIDQVHLGLFLRQRIRPSNGRVVLAVSDANQSSFKGGRKVGLSWVCEDLRLLTA